MDAALKTLFEQAYALMDQPVIDGNCGELCGYNCCRSHDHEEWGMYLTPWEFDIMQSDHKDYEVHTSYGFELPQGISKLHYIFCPDESQCLRHRRPIQCRTYPFEPHIHKGQLSLVIEKDQLHDCPLLDDMAGWRRAFIQGVYQAWSLLISVEEIRQYVIAYSDLRERTSNILIKFSHEDIMG